MPRKIISEYRAKKLLSQALAKSYAGVEVCNTDKATPVMKDETKYVVKVDQATKKRGKQGLVRVNRTNKQLAADLKRFYSKGYDYCLIEPHVKHNDNDEHYFSLRLTREGTQLLYADQGGVDVENVKQSMKEFLITDTKQLEKIAAGIGLPEQFLQKLCQFFDKNYLSMVEINPLVVTAGVVEVLDMAVEVDDAAMFFVDSWSEHDFRYPISKKNTTSEKNVEALDNNSQASFRLEELNSDGRIYMLLSGGGASVTLADEVNNLGLGKQLANYGEYSGAPNREETAYYTNQLLDLLIKSRAKNKVLVIAGGVANFTDVQVTFRGIIDSLYENLSELKKQKIKIFVRRGGPNESAGLRDMKDFITRNKLPGMVYGSSMPLTDVVTEATEEA